MNNKSQNSIWKFLCSVKLTIFILVILAATSIIGTIIPQEEAGGQFTRNLGPIFVKIVLSLQLDDMYHSVWFQGIIFLLTLNLTACSLNKLPGTFKLYKKIPSPDREKIFTDAPAHRIIKSRKSKSETLPVIKDIIKKQYSRAIDKKSDSSVYLYCDKGRYSLFGVYLVHFSILLILIGAIIGSLYGFDGYVNILEGDSVDYIATSGQNNHKHIDLGFVVSCDKFSVDFYEGGRPREYKSDIRFSLNGETVKQGHLRVNHPLTFRGITFYQASYGSIAGDEARITVKLKESNEPVTFIAETGKPIALPDKNGEVILEEIREDLMRMGPAVLLSIKPSTGEATQVWLFKDHERIMRQFSSFKQFPKFNPSAVAPYTFALDDIEQLYYTGLQVSKDPGIVYIYTGFIMIIIGLFITFFSAHRRVWIKIREDGKDTRIVIAGMANKNPVGMERELDHLTDKIKTKLDRKHD